MRIATWLKQPGMLGFRISFRHSGTHSFLDDGTADWFWADCERYDIPVMIFAPFAVAKIGADRRAPSRPARDRRPHGAQRTVERQRSWHPASMSCSNSRALRTSESKLPVSPATSTKPYPFPTLHPQIRRVVDAFGRATNFLGHRSVADALQLTAKPSHCSPKSCIFFPLKTKSGSWAELSPSGCAGRWLNKSDERLAYDPQRQSIETD